MQRREVGVGQEDERKFPRWQRRPARGDDRVVRVEGAHDPEAGAAIDPETGMMVREGDRTGRLRPVRLGAAAHALASIAGGSLVG